MEYRIEVKGLKLRGHHGVLPAEAELGQFFLLDLDLWAKRPTPFTDDLAQVLNYAEVVECVKASFLAQRYQLLETLGQGILADLKQFPQLRRAQVRIAKPAPPIPEILEAVAVTLEQVY